LREFNFAVIQSYQLLWKPNFTKYQINKTQSLQKGIKEVS